MKKLLLTSAGLSNHKITEEFLKLVNKPAPEIKIIFVPTASRTERELKYVRESKKELLELGIEDQNIKVLNLDHKISYTEVADFDVMYVCGGNTFYLLYKTRETRFGDVVHQFVENGGLYFGVSAGSVLAGSDIEIAGIEDENDVQLADLTGLNLTSVVVSPHFNEKEAPKIKEFKKKVDYEIIELTDNQALLVIGNKTEIVGT